MRNNTVLTTLILLVILGFGALFAFFPKQAAMVTGSIRRVIDPKHPDMVRLEYIATNPELSRGWRSLGVMDRPAECRTVLTGNHANNPAVVGTIAALRCVSLRANGEVIEILETRRITQLQN